MMVVPIDFCPWSPSLVVVVGVLGSELVWVRGVPVIVGALWWYEYVFIFRILLIFESERVLVVLDSLLLWTLL